MKVYVGCTCVLGKINVSQEKMSQNNVLRWGNWEKGNRSFWHKKTILYIDRGIYYIDEPSITFKYTNK